MQQLINIGLVVFILQCFLISNANGQSTLPPESFVVKFETTQGNFRIEAKKAWAPLGYERFYDLVQSGFYTDMAIYRVVRGAVVQFGIHTEKSVNEKWNKETLEDDPVVQSNKAWTVAFASAGPQTRGTEIFINLSDNRKLDKEGFAVFGIVKSGLPVIESFYNGYGNDILKDMNAIFQAGNLFLGARYPKLDYIKTAYILKEE